MAVASLIVGFGGRDLLGAYGPAAGLAGAAAASWFASTRMRTAAPVVGAVLVHLARLVGAIAVAATVAGAAPWTVVPAAAGVAAGVASIGWSLGGRWGRSGLLTVTVGGIAMSIAAETVLPLSVLLAVAGAIGVAGLPTRRGGRVAEVGTLLAALALLAPLGGLPGRWRLGPGTLARLGLRGDELHWSAPIAGIVAGAALLVVAGRRRLPVLAHLALATASANVLIGLGWDEWEPLTTTTWLALMFVIVQAAIAVLDSGDPFWRRVTEPIAPFSILVGWALAFAVSADVIASTIADGADPRRAVAPALVAVAFALSRCEPIGRTALVVTSMLMTTVAVFGATGSLTVIAISAVGAMAWFVVYRPASTAGLHAAFAATVLAVAAQSVDRTALADGVAIAVLGLGALGLARHARTGYVLTLLGIAVVLGGNATIVEAPISTTLAVGATAVMLVALRRTTTVVGASMSGAIALVAVAELAPDSERYAGDLAAASAPVAWALVALAAIGLSGWWRGERWARFVMTASAVVAVVAVALAIGADPRSVVITALLAGVTVGGAGFARPRFGIVDTAALAALGSAVGVGFIAHETTPAWIAMIAVGAAVALHGLCMLDFTIAAGGAAFSLVGTYGLADNLGAPEWVTTTARNMGLSSTDLAVSALVILLAAAGAATALAQRTLSSWTTWGPASATGCGYLLLSIAISQAPDTRLLVALTASIGLVLGGALLRSAAPLVIGTLTVIGAVTTASWSTLQTMPGWVWIGTGGVVLLGVGAIVEGRSRFEGDDPDNAADHTIRRILTSFR